MIEVELPDGRIVEIDTNDPKVASTAAQRFILSPKAQAPSDPIKDRAKKEYDEAKAKGIPVEPSATRRLLQGATFNFADDDPSSRIIQTTVFDNRDQIILVHVKLL